MSAYASIHSQTEELANVILTNKSLKEDKTVHVTIEGNSAYTKGKLYAITGDSSEIVLLKDNIEIKDNQVTLEIPALSVVQLVVAGEDVDISTETEASTQEVLTTNEEITETIEQSSDEATTTKISENNEKSNGLKPFAYIATGIILVMCVILIIVAIRKKRLK